ncbi:TPA: hypothetical protein ACJOHO_002512 [Vibrio cholerae]
MSSLGVFLLFHLLSIYLANQYYFKPYAEMDYESASIGFNIVKLVKHIGVFSACFFAVGFANKEGVKIWHKAACAISLSVPVVLLASFPDILYVTAPSTVSILNNLDRVIYYYLSAGVGLLLGFRFNKLNGI